MNRIHKISLSIFSSALLAAATMVAIPSHAQTSTPSTSGSQNSAPDAQGTQGAQSDQQLQSVSGKITSVSGKTFTLQPSSSATAPMGQQFQSQADQSPMTFTIDDNTTVSGKLKVGSNADVTYRSQNGANVAVSVRVTS